MKLGRCQYLVSSSLLEVSRVAVAGCRSQAARLAMLAALNISPRLVKPRALTNHSSAL